MDNRLKIEDEKFITTELREKANEIAEEFPDKKLRIEFPDGKGYIIPAKVPAKYWAMHEAYHNASYHGRTKEEELRYNIKHRLENPHKLSRVVRKLFSWDEVKRHVIEEVEIDSDYEKDLVSSEVREV